MGLVATTVVRLERALAHDVSLHSGAGCGSPVTGSGRAGRIASWTGINWHRTPMKSTCGIALSWTCGTGRAGADQPTVRGARGQGQFQPWHQPILRPAPRVLPRHAAAWGQPVCSCGQLVDPQVPELLASQLQAAPTSQGRFLRARGPSALPPRAGVRLGHRSGTGRRPAEPTAVRGIRRARSTSRSQLRESVASGRRRDIPSTSHNLWTKVWRSGAIVPGPAAGSNQGRERDGAWTQHREQARTQDSAQEPARGPSREPRRRVPRGSPPDGCRRCGPVSSTASPRTTGCG